MSILAAYFLCEARGKLAAYFTRVYNPVWTNPDGTRWIEMLTNEQQVELHAALTPVWSETAWYADYVLPMGVGSRYCVSTKNAMENMSSTPTRPIQVKYGRRTSSGLNCRGASTLTAALAFANISNHPIAPARSSPSKNTTAGYSKIASQDCHRRLPKNTFRRSNTCGSTGPLKFPRNKRPSSP